jgi:predicted transcriptional regulator
MTKQLTSVAILPETKSLVAKIAEATNEKKFAIYDRAIRDYARKNNINVAACGK